MSCCLIVLPHLNNVTFNAIGNLLRVYQKIIKPNRFLEFLSICPWMAGWNADELSLICRVMKITTKSNNSKSTKGLLCTLGHFSKGTSSRDETLFYVNKINESWNDKQSLSDWCILLLCYLFSLCLLRCSSEQAGPTTSTEGSYQAVATSHQLDWNVWHKHLSYDNSICCLFNINVRVCFPSFLLCRTYP